MLAADVVRFGAQGAVALLVLTHTAHIWQLVVLQAVSGTASAFFNPASTGLTPLTVSPERLQQANALRGLSMASTGIIGAAVSGALVASVGAGWALAIDAATFAVSAFFLAQLRLPPHVKLAAQSFLGDLREGWREFASRTWVWVIVLAASFGNMMSSIFVVLGAVISKDSLGGAGAWATILAALGVGSLEHRSACEVVADRHDVAVGFDPFGAAAQLIVSPEHRVPGHVGGTGHPAVENPDDGVVTPRVDGVDHLTNPSRFPRHAQQPEVERQGPGGVPLVDDGVLGLVAESPPAGNLEAEEVEADRRIDEGGDKQERDDRDHRAAVAEEPPANDGPLAESLDLALLDGHPRVGRIFGGLE